MSAPINQQISGLTVSEGGNLFAGLSNITNHIFNGPPKLLPHSVRAAFNASGKDEDLCLPNTRVNILNQIRAWIDGYDGSNIFWLSGWAGTGKSIIARTISREYYDKGRQGANFFASFFFCRGEEDVSDAGKFATSIAVQLAKYPVLGKLIDKAASDDDEIANKIPHDQWKQLVIEPLSKLEIQPVGATLVLVIDALDECDKQGDIQRVLRLMADIGVLKTIRLRILITSRSESYIRHGFSHFLSGMYHEFILHEISKSVVDSDIFIFLDQKFERLSLTGWPGDQAIERLVQKAAGLFIWAATAYRFICGNRNPILTIAKKRLDLTLQNKGSITEPEDELDKIYTTVLENSAHDDYNEEEKECVYVMLREILGSIVCLFSPLSADSLATLINFSGEELRRTLESLHSILDVPAKPDCPVRLHHPSFRDFILDTKRCADRQLQVDRNKIHWSLAGSCVWIMSNKLKKDICNLRLPGALTSDVDQNRIQQFIPDELQYACSFWVQHLQVQHLQESENLLIDNGKVHLFLRMYLLCWLEALSLLRKLYDGISALVSLEHLVEVNNTRKPRKLFQLTSTKVDQSPCLHAFIHDAIRFSLNFRNIIEKVPLQIYSSALLFAPEMSLVRKELKGQMPEWITGVTKGQKYWSQSLQILEGHSQNVKAVIFSPDGKLVASASWDKTVRLWESSTGATLQDLEGHSDAVDAVVFSPNSKLVASASRDKTVRLWDSSTGATLQVLEGHSHQVQAAVFSPDGKLVASTSRDKTVRLWDSSNGATLQILEGHSHQVEAAVFSLDGKLIASASRDETVRLWDSSTGAMLQILKGHSNWVKAVVFSPDGKLVASASNDLTVKLWDAFTGVMLQTLEGHSYSVNAVVFSPDGKLVASASDDGTIRLWNSSTGAKLQILEGHLDCVNAVVFSPDGKLVASASDDSTVRLWDSSTGMTLPTLEGHSHSVNAIVFSPDGKLVASASSDKTIRLWDSSTVVTLPTQEWHSDRVTTVRFSPNGKLVASASSDKTVKLWDSFTGATLQTLEGHSDYVQDVVFSPDGKLVASTSFDQTVRLWDTFTGAMLQTLEVHSCVIAVVLSPDGKLVESTSREKTVRPWEPSTRDLLYTYPASPYISEPPFFKYGPPLETDPDNDDSLPSSRIARWSNQRNIPEPSVHLQDRWIVRWTSLWDDEIERKLLWLPPDYEKIRSDTRDSSVVLGGQSGSVSFIHFDFSRFVTDPGGSRLTQPHSVPSLGRPGSLIKSSSSSSSRLTQSASSAVKSLRNLLEREPEIHF